MLELPITPPRPVSIPVGWRNSSRLFDIPLGTVRCVGGVEMDLRCVLRSTSSAHSPSASPRSASGGSAFKSGMYPVHRFLSALSLHLVPTIGFGILGHPSAWTKSRRPYLVWLLWIRHQGVETFLLWLQRVNRAPCMWITGSRGALSRSRGSLRGVHPGGVLARSFIPIPLRGMPPSNCPRFSSRG